MILGLLGEEKAEPKKKDPKKKKTVWFRNRRPFGLDYLDSELSDYYDPEYVS